MNLADGQTYADALTDAAAAQAVADVQAGHVFERALIDAAAGLAMGPLEEAQGGPAGRPGRGATG